MPLRAEERADVVRMPTRGRRKSYLIAAQSAPTTSRRPMGGERRTDGMSRVYASPPRVGPGCDNGGMGATEQDELRELRARAWGPAADIHDDPVALERLRTLEREEHAPDPSDPADLTHADAIASPDPERPARGLGERVGDPPAESTADGGDAHTAASATESMTGEEDAPVRTAAATTRSRRSALLAFARTRRGLRATLWSATLVVILIVALVTLAIVQRVQTAPLVPQAEQVARLAQDAGFTRPGFFGGRDADQPPLFGYEVIGGLRAMVAPIGDGFAGSSATSCLYLFQASDLDDSSPDSINGRVWQGCSAGGFPATAQFIVTADNAEGVKQRFPEGTAVQFVYDPTTNEVVVFQLPPADVVAASG